MEMAIKSKTFFKGSHEGVWQNQDFAALSAYQQQLEKSPELGELGTCLIQIIDALKIHVKHRTLLHILNGRTERKFTPHLRMIYEESISLTKSKASQLSHRVGPSLSDQAAVQCISRQLVRNLIRTAATQHDARISGCESLKSIAQQPPQKYLPLFKEMETSGPPLHQVLDKVIRGNLDQLPKDIREFVENEILGLSFTSLLQKYAAQNEPQQDVALRQIIDKSNSTNRSVSMRAHLERKPTLTPHYVYEMQKSILSGALKNTQYILSTEL